MDSEVLELLSDYTTEIVTAIVLGVVFFLLLRRYLAARRSRLWTQDPPVPVTFTPSSMSGDNVETMSTPALPVGEPNEIEGWDATPERALRQVETTAFVAPERIAPSQLATASALPEQLEKPATNVTNFGAYRIEQEVGKLAEGQPHRIEVLSSRAPEDRQAIEAALMKIFYAPDADDAKRGRARRALEDYGFVAHRCAELLMAPTLHERATAARILGAIGDKNTLPFLLESLYDRDEAVRLRAVESLGELRLPGAIGALLDLARRHPEMPPSLLTVALNSCSVDSLAFLDAPQMASTGPLLLPESDYFDEEDNVALLEDFILTPQVEAQFESEIEDAPPLSDLPSGEQNEVVLNILLGLEKADVEKQSELYHLLGRQRTVLSVQTLARAATYNPAPTLRAAAVGGLGELDHPSGFAAILLAVGDESREVRAAAARALSRLSFARSEAYLQLAQEETPERIAAIAQACIKAGMAAQALDRLGSKDSRQAYESFAMLSLLTNAGELGPLLEAVAHHRSKDVRLNTLRLLIETPTPGVAHQLRQLAISEGISDEMRNALLEAIYKIEEGNRRRESVSSNHDNLIARVA